MPVQRKIVATDLNGKAQIDSLGLNNGTEVFSNSINTLAFKGNDGFTRTFLGAGATADRIYTLPNTSSNLGTQDLIVKKVGKAGSGADFLTTSYATDDLAFQAAANALQTTGGIIQIVGTKNTYTFSNTVFLYPNTTIKGNGKSNLITCINGFTGTPTAGAVIRPSLFLNISATVTPVYFTNYVDDNIHVYDLSFDGNAVNQTTPVGGVGIQNAKNCTVERCYFNNFGTLYTGTLPNLESRGVQFRNVFRSHIIDCVDDRTDGQVISISEECSIRNGVITNGTSEGVFIGYCKRTYAINCKAYNCAGYGHTITGSGFQSYDCDLITCYAENCGDSGSVGQYDGINISGNSYRCRAINCVAVGSKRHGVLIDTSYDCQVIGGLYKNNSQVGTGLYSGVRLNLADNTIVDNVRAYDDQGTKTQAYGLSEAGTCNNTKIGVGNSFIGNLTGTISQAGRSVIETKVDFTNSPIIRNILDTNGNNLLVSTAATNAVNTLGIQNNSAGFAPRLYASGSDTNISINLISKGASGKILANSVEVVDLTSTQTLTNKTLTLPKISASYGEMYMDTANTALVSLTAVADTWTETGGITIAGNLASSFSHTAGTASTAGRLTYTGTDTKYFEISIQGVFSANVTTDNIQFRIYKNGVSVTKSFTQVKANNVSTNFITRAIFQLATNDYVQLYASCSGTSNPSVRIQTMSAIAKEISI